MKKIKKEYIAPLVSMATIAFVIIFAFSVISDPTLAWFAHNTEIKAMGMSVISRGVPNTEAYLMIDGVRVDESAIDLFSELCPSDKVTFQVFIQNNEDENIIVELFMEAPSSEDDQPYILDGLYHYMGSQIRINSVKNGETELFSASGNDRYLLTLDDSEYIGEGGDLPPTSIDSEYDFSSLADKMLAEGVIIPAGGKVALDIELEFVDNGMSQNPYIDFGSEDADDPEKAALNLFRTLILYTSYVN